MPAAPPSTKRVSRTFLTLTISPPIVNAGPDQMVLLSNGAALNGFAIDDGRPAGASLTYAWTKISGPGTVTFGNSTNATTTASFSATGQYLLRLAASDSQKTAYDEVSITATTDADGDGLLDIPALNVRITSPRDKSIIP
jgi:hypothetical protein